MPSMTKMLNLARRCRINGLLIALSLAGCYQTAPTDPSPAPAPDLVSTPASPAIPADGIAAAPSAPQGAAGGPAGGQTDQIGAKTQAWLDSGLPPMIDAEQPAPFELASVVFSTNHVDQQLLKADSRRLRAVRTLPDRVTLVILPFGGGRYDVYWDPGIVNGPAASGTISGVVDNLLDYRGEIPGGARAYLEMVPSSPIERKPPVRLSPGFWIGTDEVLASAMRSAPPVATDATDNDPSPATVPVPADVMLPEGTPIRFLAADQWRRATVWKTAKPGEPVTLLAYLARPGGLFRPWELDVDWRDTRIESAALEELRMDSHYFDERFNTYRQRVASSDAPLRLEPAAGRPVAGQRLLAFWGGGLDPVEVVSVVQEDVVRVRRTGLDRAEMDKQLASLYIDPEPDSN
jgi:hypothetical protein